MTDVVVVALLVPLGVMWRVEPLMAGVLTAVGCYEAYEYFRGRLKK